MQEHQVILLFFLGVLLGVAFGWLTWRLPELFAAQRGIELDEDGYTICKKEIAEAGRKAICAQQEQK